MIVRDSRADHVIFLTFTKITPLLSRGMLFLGRDKNMYFPLLL